MRTAKPWLFFVLFLTAICLTEFMTTPSMVFAQGESPDLVPWNMDRFRVTQRLGGPTLEYGNLTANIGAVDYKRPRNPDGTWSFTVIYQYTLSVEQDGEWVQIDQRDKPIICTIDMYTAAACIQEHGRVFTCDANQGISRGWADDYFPTLQGQWVFLGDYTGRFWLNGKLDPYQQLQADGLPPESVDANPDNNDIDVILTWDGSAVTVEETIRSYDNPC
ncbi:MAG: hypothetical protein HYR55_12415 [Acidobacteria bacterium]|nr:hypothetical protein [Acidobacteriota bacterium]MBI3656278.1 hypothetical protein [Acidobacteriota bacterium]